MTLRALMPARPSDGWASFGLGARAVEYRVLLALVTIQGFAWFLVFPLMPLYARNLGAEPALIGFLMAFPAVFQVILCLPGGMLVRRLGEKGVFFLSFAFGIGAAVAYYSAHRVEMLFLGQMLFGASHAVFWPALTSYLGDLGSGLASGGGRLISFALGLNAVSYLAGPPLAGYLMEGVGSRYIFLLYLLVCLVGWERLRLLVRSDATGSIDRGIASAAASSGVGGLFGIPTFRFVVIGTWFSFASWGILDTLFPLHVIDLGYAPSALGLMLTLRSVVIVVCRFGAAGLGEILGFRRVAVLGLGLLSVSLLVLARAQAPWLLILASSVAGAGPGLLPVANITLLAGTLSGAMRPLGMAVNELFVGTGRLVGSSLSGIGAAAFGMGLTIGSAGGALAGAAAIMAAFAFRIPADGSTGFSGE